jgi:hypothetical protein
VRYVNLAKPLKEVQAGRLYSNTNAMLIRELQESCQGRGCLDLSVVGQLVRRVCAARTSLREEAGCQKHPCDSRGLPHRVCHK